MSKKPTAGSNLILSNLVDEKFDHKLRNTTPLKKLPEPLRSELKNLYSRSDLKANLLACLLNGLFTEGIVRFLFSVREMEALVRADKNLKRKSLNDKEFSTFKAWMISKNVIELMSQSTQFKQGQKGKAAFAKLIHMDMLKLLRKELVDEDGITQEQSEYEERLQIKGILPELEAKMRESARARKKSQITDDPELLAIMKELEKI